MQPIRIYTTPTCPYCHAAKDLLSQQGLAFEETDVQADPALRARLAAENDGYRTVPMIFIGDEFVGGFTDMKSLHDRGELLAKAGKD